MISNSVNKSVVYTCLYGNSDQLNEQPISVNSNTDFICFTDNRDLKSDSWKVRFVGNCLFEPARESRRPKTMPHLFLAEYDYSLYIDNTIKLKVSPEEIFSKNSLMNTSIKVFSHPFRNCIYEEAEEVLWCGMDTEVRVWEQVEYYKSNNYPYNNGLAAGCFILRRHNDPCVRKFGELWFQHILRFSKRDQLSFNFCAKTIGIEYDCFEDTLLNNNILTYGNWRHELPADFNVHDYSCINNIPIGQTLQHFKTIGKKQKLKYRYHKYNHIRTLFNKYKLHSGTLYGTQDSFCRVYSKFLDPLKYSKINVLLISSCKAYYLYDINNTQVELWCDYFKQAYISILNISQYCSKIDKQKKYNKRLIPESPPLVIIDTSNADSNNQLRAIQLHINILKSGGFCFIENLHRINKVNSNGLFTKIFYILKSVYRIPLSLLETKSLLTFSFNVLMSRFSCFDSMNTDCDHNGQDCFLVIQKYHPYNNFYVPVQSLLNRLRLFLKKLF